MSVIPGLQNLILHDLASATIPSSDWCLEHVAMGARCEAMASTLLRLSGAISPAQYPPCRSACPLDTRVGRIARHVVGGAPSPDGGAVSSIASHPSSSAKRVTTQPASAGDTPDSGDTKPR